MSRLGEPRSRPLDERLTEKIVEKEDGCWEWSGKVMTNGYARIYVNGRDQLVHRVMYERVVGPIPDGLVIDHLCRNKRCVRPLHLETVTIAENLLRGESNAHKTHCPKGHPYAGENLILESGPTRRRCRTCRADQKKARNVC